MLHLFRYILICLVFSNGHGGVSVEDEDENPQKPVMLETEKDDAVEVYLMDALFMSGVCSASSSMKKYGPVVKTYYNQVMGNQIFFASLGVGVYFMAQYFLKDINKTKPKRGSILKKINYMGLFLILSILNDPRSRSWPRHIEKKLDCAYWGYLVASALDLANEMIGYGFRKRATAD